MVKMAKAVPGQKAPRHMLINPGRLVKQYYVTKPSVPVEFGTSGIRGTSNDGTFTDRHVRATVQAIVDHRTSEGISGPLFLGMDTHALSKPAMRTALSVLAANGVNVILQGNGRFTPTPVVSRAILAHNFADGRSFADGIIITPSHNPPEDGGLKYNPPHGGPSDTDVTGWIEGRANSYMRDGNVGVKSMPFDKAIKAGTTHRRDLITPFAKELGAVVDMDAIRSSGIKIGVDPLGGAAVHYWGPIADMWGLNLEVVNDVVDPTFSFMTVDHDGKIRMDCSSPHAMASLIGLKDKFDVAIGNDPDGDRHGIVTKSGLMIPNHYLSVAIWYLFQNRQGWGSDARIGKTLVSSSMIDRVAASIGREVVEVPVGFKWFVQGLFSGEFGFGGEESAGAAFLRRDGSVWTTDKCGITLGLLAAEIMAKTEKSPREIYAVLTAQFGEPIYKRKDAPASDEEKKKLKGLKPEDVAAGELAGEKILARLTNAPGNDAPIGGLKVVTENGWFAARPSGTEAVYKIYAESFKGEEHLKEIQEEARAIVAAALKK